MKQKLATPEKTSRGASQTILSLKRFAGKAFISKKQDTSSERHQPDIQFVARSRRFTLRNRDKGGNQREVPARRIPNSVSDAHLTVLQLRSGD